ncbi:DUF4390 domain-containing protein [uncultured Methylibium sp.]|uniref:DUF4390 domain-containing protein n=1 Tax=uncultured Methylibium sp. TaxID=381093 RepID=UPI0025CF330E|nr:DUF4390 domain-containing protein [uncultured Methylibium sp.]
MFTAWVRCWFQPRAARPAPGAPWLWVVTAICLVVLALPARADKIELTQLELTRDEEGLLLGYQARIELPRAVEDAMLKGVPLYFVAEAELLRSRWYWRDKRVVRASRNWRVTWQPLTRRYRVNFGSLSQTYDTLSDALGAVQRATRWKLADPADLEDGARQYVEFSLRLDTSQLPRPLQISFGGQAEWTLGVERTLTVPEALPPSPPPPPAK